MPSICCLYEKTVQAEMILCVENTARIKLGRNMHSQFKFPLKNIGLLQGVLQRVLELIIMVLK